MNATDKTDQRSTFEAIMRERSKSDLKINRFGNYQSTDIQIKWKYFGYGYQTAIASQAQQPNYGLNDLAQIIMSDCGISTANNDHLYDRILGRLIASSELQSMTQKEPESLVKKFCSNCASFRSGDKCHKCGGDTFKPHKAFTEQKLPPIEIIRTIAREAGYAVAVHGTQERDLDVIAAPWTEDAVGNHELMERIAKGINAVILETEKKPLGRYAATIQIDGWYKPLDLSVCPRLEPKGERK